MLHSDDRPASLKKKEREKKGTTQTVVALSSMIYFTHLRNKTCRSLLDSRACCFAQSYDSLFLISLGTRNVFVFLLPLFGGCMSACLRPTRFGKKIDPRIREIKINQTLSV